MYAYCFSTDQNALPVRLLAPRPAAAPVARTRGKSPPPKVLGDCRSTAGCPRNQTPVVVDIAVRRWLEIDMQKAKRRRRYDVVLCFRGNWLNISRTFKLRKSSVLRSTLFTSLTYKFGRRSTLDCSTSKEVPLPKRWVREDLVKRELSLHARRSDFAPFVFVKQSIFNLDLTSVHSPAFSLQYPCSMCGACCKINLNTNRGWSTCSRLHFVRPLAPAGCNELPSCILRPAESRRVQSASFCAGAR